MQIDEARYKKNLAALPVDLLEVPFYRRARAALALRLGNISDAEDEKFALTYK